MGLAAVLALVILASGCCPCRKGASKNNRPLEGTMWQVTSIAGTAIPASGDAFTLMLSDGTLAGKGSCNRLAGSYEMTGNNAISFSRVVSTRMMCLNHAAEEDAYAKRLNDIDAYTVDGDTLMLLSNGEAVIVMTVMQTAAE